MCKETYEQPIDGDHRWDFSWLADKIQKGKGFGLVGNLVIRVLGSVFGSWLFWQLGYTTYGFWGNLVVAVIGALVILYVVRLLAKR